MPRLDGTGPQGRGARTGRNMGPCGRARSAGRFGFKGNWSKSELEEYKTGLEKELEDIIEAIKKKN